MHLRKITLSELPVFMESDEFRNLISLPITRQRALSYLNNPRADNNDTVLYLAWEANSLIGYRLVLPDKIFLKNQVVKAGWFSAVWVSPALRGKGIARAMVMSALEDWNNKIILQDPVKESSRLYMRTGAFSDKIVLTGIRGYLRSNLRQIIPAKFPGLRFLKSLFALVDSVFNSFNELRLLFQKRKKVNASEIHEIDEEVWNFIRSFKEKELFRRDRNDLNWIIRYPWVLQGEKDSEALKYHFSAKAGEFFLKKVKVFNENNKLTGFMMMSVRDGHLKIPYIYFYPEAMADMVQELYNQMLQHKLTMLTVFNKEISSYIQNHTHPFIFIKKIKRQYLFSKDMEQELSGMEEYLICDGDGDAAFT